jgi:hypothetical protein
VPQASQEAEPIGRLADRVALVDLPKEFDGSTGLRPLRGNSRSDRLSTATDLHAGRTARERAHHGTDHRYRGPAAVAAGHKPRLLRESEERRGVRPSTGDNQALDPAEAASLWPHRFPHNGRRGGRRHGPVDRNCRRAPRVLERAGRLRSERDGPRPHRPGTPSSCQKGETTALSGVYPLARDRTSRSQRDSPAARAERLRLVPHPVPSTPTGRFSAWTRLSSSHAAAYPVTAHRWPVT